MIAALKEGDESVFESVFHEYHEKIYLYILNKTQSPYLAEETTQLTFIKLWQYRSSLTEDYTLFTQIFRMARTTLIDLLRKQDKRQSLQTKSPDKTTLMEHASVLDKMAAEELQKKLNHAIDTMPPVRKQVFTMSRMQHMSTKEIADTLGLSVKTVEGHITQALKQLREVLIVFLILHLF
ncbi:RNA polymerase sigma-70 factor [Chitinophaga silvisoli]|uniref:RNA polymerase sigma-70 factor n=1 Tax=Chitinophaga silvisoli TaxID=2291814 RepID=A0A3E1P7M7_9BACT|nr:RNA polymerase sigma-70 factor [Chitinophaga silvisoli]RFM36209.1 RNA polymerase sigma-70 factor [Chitinophaga silvisoli]